MWLYNWTKELCCAHNFSLAKVMTMFRTKPSHKFINLVLFALYIYQGNILSRKYTNKTTYEPELVHHKGYCLNLVNLKPIFAQNKSTERDWDTHDSAKVRGCTEDRSINYLKRNCLAKAYQCNHVIAVLNVHKRTTLFCYISYRLVVSRSVIST